MQDLRYGLRLLRRSPAFKLTAVTTLGLTIGAVCTVLTLAHTLFLQTLPVPRAAEVVELRPTRDEGTRTGFVSYPDYVHFRDSTRAVHDLAAVYPTAPLFGTSADEAREANGAVVSANFFSMLELEPVLGRFFAPEEDAVPERDPVVVIGFDFWRTWFGQDPEAIGAALKINTVPFTVIGVAEMNIRVRRVKADLHHQRLAARARSLEFSRELFLAHQVDRALTQQVHLLVHPRESHGHSRAGD